MQPTPKELTRLLPLISTFGLPIYVARVPAAPFREQAGPIARQLQKSVSGAGRPKLAT